MEIQNKELISENQIIDTYEHKPKEFKIISMNINNTWNYKNAHNSNHQCGLCRKHLQAPTENQLKNIYVSEKISVGKCEHMFHTDCINNYLSKKNISCPIDMTPWKTDKEYVKNNKV